MILPLSVEENDFCRVKYSCDRDKMYSPMEVLKLITVLLCCLIVRIGFFDAHVYLYIKYLQMPFGHVVSW